MVLTEIILVDERARTVGTMGKLHTHREGTRHRAVTVYLFNPDGQLLLQRAGEILLRRSLEQHRLRPHHAGGRKRRSRLYEEMGMRVALMPVLQLCYRLPLYNGLIEHEYGHVFFGVTPLAPMPDLDEAMPSVVE